MTVYLDIVLLENICMNYIILYATGLINKVKINNIRIFLSSLLGGTYAVMSFISILEIYSTIILKLILSVSMVYLAFKPKKIRTLVKEIIIFYLTSFALGGAAFFLLYFIKPQDILIKNGVYIGTYPIKIALLGGIVGFIVINIAFKIIKGKLNKKSMFCDIEINFMNKTSKVKAMIDTGNLLKEPITMSPVIVVEKNMLEEVIPNNILDNIDKIISGKSSDIIDDLDEKYKSRFKVIPFSSLGKQNGILLGFRADKVIIEYEENEIEQKNIIIAIYNQILSKYEKYTALIGIDLLEEGGIKKNEYITNIKK